MITCQKKIKNIEGCTKPTRHTSNSVVGTDQLSTKAGRMSDIIVDFN